MKQTPTDWFDMLPGVRRRILADGERVMIVELHFDKGAAVPVHQHMHEQVSNVATGKMRFTLDGEAIELNQGELLHVPGNAPHSATALEASTLIETFSPPREDFRAKK